jgi:hypothetical protein
MRWQPAELGRRRRPQRPVGAQDYEISAAAADTRLQLKRISSPQILAEFGDLILTLRACNP